MPKASHGINPVTIRQTHPRWPGDLCLTIGRLHLRVGGETFKPVTVVVYREQADGDRVDPANILANFIVDEEEFCRGLHHLFPTGELDAVGDASPTVNQELLNVLREFVEPGEGDCQALRARARALVERYE